MHTASDYRSSVGRALLLAIGGLSTVAAADCGLARELTFSHAEIGPVQVFRDPTSHAVAFASQMQVNTDGAPDSYHPDDIGITHICNGVSVGASCTWKAQCLPEFRQAKAEGFRGPTKICFFAMATDTHGRPIIQGPTDPTPGYFVSITALHQAGADPRLLGAQLDANTASFDVIPTNAQRNGTAGPVPGAPTPHRSDQVLPGHEDAFRLVPNGRTLSHAPMSQSTGVNHV
jgi:hypothetical protein